MAPRNYNSSYAKGWSYHGRQTCNDFACCTRCNNWSWADRLKACGGKCQCGAWFGEAGSKAKGNKGGGGHSGSGGYGGGGSSGKGEWAYSGSKWQQWQTAASEEELLASALENFSGSAAAPPAVQAAIKALREVYKTEEHKPKWDETKQAHMAAQKLVVAGRSAVKTRAESVKKLEDKLESSKALLVQEQKDLEETEAKAKACSEAFDLASQQAQPDHLDDEVDESEAGSKASSEEVVTMVAEYAALGAKIEAAKNATIEREKKDIDLAARLQSRAAEQTATGAVKRIRADGGNVEMEAETEQEVAALAALVAPALG
jgi:hypothetical protein